MPASKTSLRARSISWLQVGLVFVVFVALWEAAVRVFAISPVLLPSPQDVAVSLTQVVHQPMQPGGYGIETWHTMSAALLGWVISAVLGIAIAIFLVWFPLFSRLLLPYIVAFQVLPRLAIAPLFIIWFGHGLLAKVVLASLFAFFPVLVNTVTGLNAAPAEGIELMQSLRASKLQIFRYYSFPNSLPYIFAGLEVAIVFSVLGVIVAEFVGGTNGLGVMILQFHYNIDIGGVFAVLIVLALLGLLMRGILIKVRDRMLFWLPAPDSVSSS
ncbi:MAG TPA: ABC transporter permease [Candidatus Nitrosotalea sp.]|nr:ABC transporter permease [Candidatus Nitrosotalea sp.]